LFLPFGFGYCFEHWYKSFGPSFSILWYIPDILGEEFLGQMLILFNFLKNCQTSLQELYFLWEGGAGVELRALEMPFQ
jgi:hypothetical protein